MTDAESCDRTELVAGLERLRQQLLHSLRETQDAERPLELDQTKIGRLTRIDAIQQQSMTRANRRATEARLHQIEAALERVAQGEYGECCNCGETIATARLRVRPEASLCVTCQERAERR